MNISSFNTLKNLPQTHEFSKQRNPRDDGSVQTLWKKVGEVIESSNRQAQFNNQIARDIKRLTERKSLDLDLFPFALYTLPDELRPSTDSVYYTSSINWRTVRCRGGLVLTSLISTSSFVNGTDRCENFAYSSNVPLTVGSYDIQVPLSQSNYYFWIENSGSVPTPTTSSFYLRYGSNPTGSIGNDNNPNPWTSWPSASSTHWIVGWCDTVSSASVNNMIVRQIQTTDITTTPISYISMSVCENNQSVKYFVAAYKSGSSAH